MARFKVFVDTNIFVSAKYNFTGGSLYSLKKYCNRGMIEIITNDIILREVRRHIADDIDLLSRQAKNAIKKHGELINAITRSEYKRIESTLLTAASNLLMQFDSFIGGATILPNNGLSIEALFNDYFDYNAPFENREEKKSEFPDAVAIMSIKRYLEENADDNLYIVTDDNGWHNALEGVNGVVLYKELKDLLTQIAKEEELYFQIARYMGDCLEKLQSYVEDWIFDQDWTAVVDNIEMCIECDEINDVRIDSVKVVPDGVEYIDKDDDYAVAVFSGVVRISLDFPYTDHSNETYDREDHVWFNTIYGNGIAEIEVPFSGSVTVLFSDDGQMNFDSPDFSEIDFCTVEILEYELTPYVENDDSYFNICPDCGNPIGIHNDGGNGFCTECASRH